MPFIQYGIVAGVQAMRDSGLGSDGRTQAVLAPLSAGIGGLGRDRENHSSLVKADRVD